jgi:hypothetical protein
VFVTFAVFDGYPAASNAGKLMSEPPPATAFTAPAASAAAERPAISRPSIRRNLPRVDRYEPIDTLGLMPAARPIVTFDMDGVLCRPPFGINPGKGRSKRRDAPGTKSLLWLTERWRYALRKPMPGAVEGFHAVAAIAEVCVLSARGEQARPAAEAWFRRHFGLIPKIYLRPSWRESSAQFKARRVVELGAVAHFEDDPFTAKWVAELVPQVFLVDWRRNRWLDEPNVHRIKRIAEALPLLDPRPGPG